MFRHLLIGALAIQALAACAPVEPIGKGDPLQFEEDEQRLWTSVKAEEKRLDKSGALYDNAVVKAYVNDVAQRIIPEQVKGKGLSIEIRVLANPLLNAFAYPNGVIYVHTGILARMENEAQLATLLGHEMTHATHRHAIQQLRSAQIKGAALATLQMASIPFGIFGALASTLGAVGYVAAVTGYSRGMEVEADAEGLNLMVGVGYDPTEAPKLFHHLMEDLEEQQVSEPFFFGTHPRLQERIESYAELLERRYAGRTGAKNEEQFMVQVLPVILDNASLDLSLGRYGVAQHGIGRVLRWDSGNAKAHYYLGEVFRQRGMPGEKEQAEQEYQLATQYGPDYPEPHKALGLLYLKQGHIAKAAKAWARYLALAPRAADRAHIEQHLRELQGE